ncbi:hypothetical protein [Dyadobacter luticola]|uniref:Uncharacterized protein n=1 Tax=Dyadobacter luticola TaxID=1979387 RepID=A0A5R9KWH9_9BACT|nr:hypothetical protein [Dyadobacter luticola]TLV00490.1 hypothetical protein FEN17_13460 [Dyadobacter luticola]
MNIQTILDGLPGLSKTSASHLYEGCVVCLARHNHSYKGTQLALQGDATEEISLAWNNIFDDQLDRTWADQFYATEHGAVCLAILIALRLTDYTIVEKSARKNGFDYWLGKKDDILFQRKARLEISGIFKGKESDMLARHKVKIKQTNPSDNLLLPAYVGIVEFSKPMAIFGVKK